MFTRNYDMIVCIYVNNRAMSYISESEQTYGIA